MSEFEQDKGTDQPPATTKRRDDAEMLESDAPKTGYARYEHLRANVRRRRTGYKLFILFAVLVFLLACVDIIFLDRAPGVEYLVYGLLAVLFVWAIVLLFSRARDQEELEEIRNLERTLLQCPDCKNVFQYGQIHFTDHKEGVFTCPVCGNYGRLPKPDAQPVKALAPQGNLKEFGYQCRNCGEEIRVGTYGEAPIHAVRFRTCPNCGEKNYVERIPLEGRSGPVEGPPVQLPGREGDQGQQGGGWEPV